MTTTTAKRQPELRITPSELKALYNKGKESIFSSHSYLYCLIRALRKDGWKLHIISVKEFCTEWEISERSFYRAKSKLHELGMLGEKIHGALDLWITNNGVQEDTNEAGETDNSGSETDNSGSETDNSGSETDNSGSETDNSASETPPELPPSSTSSTSSSSLHLTTSLSHSEPEREITKSLEEEPGSNPKSLASLLPAIETTYEVVTDQEGIFGANTLSKNIPRKDQGSAAATKTVEDVEPEFFNWVLKRVLQFPNPPIFPRQVAITLIKRGELELRAEYDSENKRRQQSLEASYTPPTPPPIEDPIDEDAMRLARLQAKWNLTFGKASHRSKVLQELEVHPEWGIEIADDQLQLITPLLAHT